MRYPKGQTQRLPEEEIRAIMAKRWKAIAAMPPGRDRGSLIGGHTARLATNNIDTPRGHAPHSAKRT